MDGRHETTKKRTDPTFSAEWSGVSRATHAPYNHVLCGEQLHDENGNMYCPRCDDYVGDIELAKHYMREGIIGLKGDEQ